MGVRRKAYANFKSGRSGTRLTDRRCPNGHCLTESYDVKPEPFLFDPPYKRTPKIYRERVLVDSEWCRECNYHADLTYKWFTAARQG